jgi:pimeloyl-ACP methyl ester carboxylesterase
VLLLVHSPLVGPSSWLPTARRLEGLGYEVVVPSLAGLTAAGPPYLPRLADAAAGAVEPGRPVVVVGHSRGGPLLPAVADRIGDAVRGAVFVDSRLPHPGVSAMDAMAPAARERLRALARDGRLPGWHEWFGSIAELVPDAGLRDRLVAEIEELPLAYFAEPAPAVDTPTRCAYVQLSEAYREPADEAAGRGWPTYRAAADHLAVLTRPELVAGLVDAAVRSVAGGAAAGSAGSGTRSGS